MTWPLSLKQHACMHSGAGPRLSQSAKLSNRATEDLIPWPLQDSKAQLTSHLSGSLRHLQLVHNVVAKQAYVVLHLIQLARDNVDLVVRVMQLVRK